MGDLEGDLDTFRGVGTAKSDGGFKTVESMTARGTARGTAHRAGKVDDRDLDRGMKKIPVGAPVECGQEGRISVRRRYGYSSAVKRCLLILRTQTPPLADLAATTIAKQSGPPATFAFTGHTCGPRRANQKRAVQRG